MADFLQHVDGLEIEVVEELPVAVGNHDSNPILQHHSSLIFDCCLEV